MMTNQKPTTKPAGSLPTTWELRTYDVWGNSKDGYEVNDVRSAGEVELHIPITRYDVGTEWYVCRNLECPGNNPCGHTPACAWGTHRRESHSVVPHYRSIWIPSCPECGQVVSKESQEFCGAYPTDRQIKRAFGVTCRISTDGDDTGIDVTRARDGYPIGEMTCISHASLSPVQAKGKMS